MTVWMDTEIRLRDAADRAYETARREVFDRDGDVETGLTRARCRR
jgi:hypothetical protein